MSEQCKEPHAHPSRCGCGEAAEADWRNALRTANAHTRQLMAERDALHAEAEALTQKLADFEELHGGEHGLPSDGWPTYHKRKMETLRDLHLARIDRLKAKLEAADDWATGATLALQKKDDEIEALRTGAREWKVKAEEALNDWRKACQLNGDAAEREFKLRTELEAARVALQKIAHIPGDSINFHPSHMRRIARQALTATPAPEADA